jgi:hypothetical protein
MADEEKKYLITATADVSAAIAELERLQGVMNRLGTGGGGSTTAATNSVAAQAREGTRAINEEIAAFERLGQARQQTQSGGLVRVQNTEKETRSSETGDLQSRVSAYREESEALKRITQERFDAENKSVSKTITDVTDLRAQRNVGLQFTDISRTVDATGKVQELAVSYQNVAGRAMEVNRVVSENGNVIARTATSYAQVDGQIRGTTKSVEEFSRVVSSSGIDKLAERESQTMLRDMDEVRRQTAAARTIQQESYRQLDTARRADPQGATQALANQPYANVTRTIDAAGNVKELTVQMQAIAGANGKVMEVNRTLTENGKIITQTGTAYRTMGGEIKGTTQVTKEFTDTAAKGVGTLDHLAKRISFMAEWFAFYAVIQLVQAGLQAWNQAQIALSDEMANFDIVTRGSNASAEAYLTTVNAISKATAINPAEIGPGVVAQMRVFNAPSDLALRAAQVQRVTGVDNAQVQREIMGLRLQFPDRSTISILDSFSGALKRSSLTAAELFNLLETAGPLSQQFNTGLEQIIGMMAGLSTVTSESGQAVELYMRQLDRLYSDPRTRGKIEEFTGKRVTGTDLTTGQEVRRPIYDVMADIAKLDQSQVQEIANTIPNALGQKTRQLFVAMINGWANVEDATKSSLNAQGEFLSQNERKMQSYQAKIDGLTAAWQRYLRALEIAPVIPAALVSLTKLLDRVAVEREVMADPGLAKKYGIGPDAERGGLTARGTTLSQARTQLTEAEIYAVASKIIAEREVEARATEFKQNYPSDWPSMQARALGAGIKKTDLVNLPDEYQKVSGPSDLVGKAQRLYAERLEKEIAAYAQQTTGEATTTAVMRGVIMEKIGAIGAETAIYNETTGQMVIVNAEAGRLAEAMALAGDALKKGPFPEKYGQGLMGARGEGDIEAWVKAQGEKLPYGTIPQQKFELPAQGFDFTAARKLMQENVESYRGQFPQAVVGKTDTQVLDLMGISSRFTVFTDQFGNALGSVDVPLQYLASAAASAAGALAGLSFVSPPEGVSLGAFGAGIEARAGRFDQILAKNSPEPPKTRKQIFADETGTYETKKEYSDQAVALASAATSKYYSAALAQGQQANALLKQINEGVRGFAEKLLAPTAVTKGDMALAKTGGYKDKWDEPVRRIQDVMDRREGMNPDLGPWKGFAESMGIDLSSIDSTVASGEQFKTKFYSGQMAPEFYDQYSKEGFLRSAQEELAAQKGKERLTDQATGWLKESGMSKDLSKFIGRKLTGNVSPIEDMLYAGKDPAKVGADVEESSKPIGDGLVKGIGSAFTFDKMYAALEASWKLNDSKAQDKIFDLGSKVGALLTSGAATSFGDKFLDAVIAAVVARLDKEYI